jgi:hypothetical protein
MTELYRALAVAALGLHLVWILWVVFGWLVTKGRPGLRWAHIGSLVYAILIELFWFPCPLTLAENFFLARAGERPYEESFLIHYLDAIIYPNVPQPLVTGVAIAVCLLILGLYALRFCRRTAAGW